MAIDKALIGLFGTGLTALLSSLTGAAASAGLIENGERLLDLVIRENGPNPRDVIAAFAIDLREELTSGRVTAAEFTQLGPKLARLISGYPPLRSEIASVLDAAVLETTSAANGIVARMAERARADGAFTEAGIDEAKAIRVLELLFGRLIAGEDYLEAVIPYFERYIDGAASAEDAAADVAAVTETEAADAAAIADQSEPASEPEAVAPTPLPPPVPEPPPVDPAVEAARLAAQAAQSRKRELEWAARAKLGRSLARAEATAAAEQVPLLVLAEVIASAEERRIERSRIEQRLAEKARLYRQLVAGIEALEPRDAVMDRLVTETLVALEEADFRAADDLISGIEARVVMAATNGKVNGSGGELPMNVRLIRAELLELRSSYLEAARNYSLAAEGGASGLDRRSRWELAMREGAALTAEADEVGNDVALGAAIDVYSAAVELCRRSESVDDWRETHTCLGICLLRLGEKLSETDKLEAAARAFRAAIEVEDRDKAPARWAMLQRNLGTSLLRVGEVEAVTEAFVSSAEAYEKALEGLDPKADAADWAMANNNLGTALARIADARREVGLYERAINAFTNALVVYRREDMPGRWGMTKMNLANALLAIGEERDDPLALKQAIGAYSDALGEMRREDTPLNWALSQFNLGTAWHRLSRSENGTNALEQALVGYQAALDGYTRESAPMQWAKVHSCIGTVMSELGERTGSVGFLEKAAAAYGATLEEWTRTRVPLQWALSHANLGNTLWAIGEFRRDATLLQMAANEITAALEVFRSQAQDQYEATAQDNLRALQSDIRRLSRTAEMRR